MNDRPEAAGGGYGFGDSIYRLEEAASEVWSVNDGERYFCIIAAAETAVDDRSPQYVAKPTGKGSITDVESTDD